MKRHFFVLCVILLSIELSVSLDIHTGIPFGNEIEETDHWAVELEEGTDPFEIAKRHGHEFIGKVGNLENIYLFKKSQETIYGITHPHHEESKEIVWNERQVARKRAKRSISDPLYNQQWHLHEVSAMKNVHINTAGAWDKGITGKGVTIAIVDDGVEYTHPDITTNYRKETSWDFNYNDDNPFPDNSYDDHGTPAAGSAAAVSNSACGVGSAYNSGISGIRLLGKSSTDADEAGSLSYMINSNHIFSNSWGPTDDGRRKEGPGKLASSAIEKSIHQGRNGKGTIYIWAGGNGRRSGDNCNYDGWANSRYTITISAVDYKGIQSWYSENCAMIISSAPSSGTTYSITTTDLRGSRGTSNNDCTSTFGGTSAAAPIAAGVAALILESNPNLSWRDVQGVFIESSKVTDPNDSDWIVNGGGYKVNHKYGFGLIDASVAVDVSKSWKYLGPILQDESYIEVNNDIPLNSYISIDLPININFTVEHVELIFVATHKRRGDLRIILESPYGTPSILAEPHGDNNQNYNWKFGSIRSWGESSYGVWSLKVSDETPNNVGKIDNVKLIVYGH